MMIRKERNILKIVVPIIVFFIGCGAMYGIIYSFPSLFNTNITKLEKNVTVTDTGIADSVEKVYDSVVIVSTFKKDTLYSTGTGFVFKSDNDVAYILTNNHVIEGGSKISVTFTNGEVVETEVVGSNVLSDIAVLSVDVDDIISVAEIGESKKLRVGDTAFAVGAPLDSVYSWTVTRGIISGKDRMVEVTLSEESGDYIMKVLQTDAAINSGNSGGPLCNSNGEVVGITSLKLVDESVEGMGFAIPIEIALEYAEKMIKGKSITQPYLGVSMLNITDVYYYPSYYRQYYNYIEKYDISYGVLVHSVEKNSPADKAGLKSNDVITHINNEKVTSIAYLRYYLYDYEPGDKITITYIRENDTKKATVTLGNSEKTY